MSTNPKPKTSAPTRSRRVFPAKVKCEAVLAVWSERRKPSEICRELQIPWQQLQGWQTQSLEAMLERLQPQRDPQQPSPALGNRLQNLLEKTERRLSAPSRMQKRLETAQKSAPPPPKTS